MEESDSNSRNLFKPLGRENLSEHLTDWIEDTFDNMLADERFLISCPKNQYL